MIASNGGKCTHKLAFAFFRKATDREFVKGSIGVSEGVLGDSGSHPYPSLSISYGS